MAVPSKKLGEWKALIDIHLSWLPWGWILYSILSAFTGYWFWCERNEDWDFKVLPLFCFSTVQFGMIIIACIYYDWVRIT